MTTYRILREECDLRHTVWQRQNLDIFVHYQSSDEDAHGLSTNYKLIELGRIRTWSFDEACPRNDLTSIHPSQFEIQDGNNIM